MSSVCPKCGKEFGGPSIGSHGLKCGVTYEMLFWQKVDKSAGPDKCWPWTGAITSWGYDHFNSKRHGEYMAHRLAWELANGRKPPAGFQNGTVMHTCDNPPCCNPAHLKLGTHTDNMRDMRLKVRDPRMALTPEKVREIRAELAANDEKGVQVKLAAKYGVSPGTISGVYTGKNYRYVK